MGPPADPAEADIDRDPAAARADELLPLMLDQARDHALVLLDPEGIVVGWLAGAQNLLGYEEQEIVGQHSRLLFTHEERARLLPEYELRLALAQGRAEDDRWHVRKDGTRIWVSGVVYALRAADGRHAGFGKVMRDRTDVREQLSVLEGRLEAAQAASDRKNLFVATLAHELRNPLGVITNALAILGVGGLPQQQAWAVDALGRQAGFMTRLVTDLLDAARIGAGTFELKRGPLDLPALLRVAAEASQPVIESRQQSLQVLLLPGTTVVDGDPDRLRQVFVNLLDNASKYTGPGGRIWLTLTVETNDAVVRVSDNGRGVDPALLPRLFDLFTQGDGERRAGTGLGLGLALVRELVTLHGGSVQVRSQGLGRGSEFTVRLPLAQAKAANG